MEKAELKSFGKPDEVREFPKGCLELLKIGGATYSCHEARPRFCKHSAFGIGI